MKKFILTAAALFAAAGVQAAGFELNAGSPTLLLKAAAPVLAEPAAPSKPAKAKAGQAVQISGRLTLTGNAWIYQNGGYSSVNLGGWARFSDASGKIYSDNVYVTVNAGMWLYPNQHLFQSVFPSTQVQLYRDGKPLGTALMRGSFTVSGWATSNSVNIGGSGNLTGSLYVAEQQP
jgi:hypothetical protein